MKKVLTLICFVFSAVTLFPQNNCFTYQAVVRDNNNHLATDQVIGVRLSLIRDIPNGAADYIETHTVQTNANGLMVLLVGKGTVISGSMTNVDWTTHRYYLKSEFDISGGTNYTISGTELVTGVPFAQYAADVNYTETQTLSISNDTIYLNGGTNSSIKLPARNANIPDSISSFINDVGYITSDSIPANISYFNNDAGYITSYTDSQQISMNNDTLKIERGGSVIIPLSCDSMAATIYSKTDSLVNVVDSLSSIISALEAIACQAKILTTVVTDISSDTAVCCGYVTSPCGNEITEKGVCWNTTGSADLTDDHTTDGNGIGDFTSVLTNLSPNTRYYVRAYAICGNKTVYGADMVFVTK